MVNKYYFPPNLPITAVKDELIELIKQHQVLIVAGETGSGKTTQLPKLCLAAECVAETKMIACTQPRRIAAASVSKRVSDELGDEGDIVGYRVRFIDRTAKTTKIKFLTDGLLLAEAAADRSLGKYDVIIIDEAHERSLNIDFLLGFLKKLLKRRPELKVIVSSATLDTEKFSQFFSNAKVATIPGTTFPIEVRYAPSDPDGKSDNSIVDEAVEAVRQLLVSSASGDILVFMPTERDIIETVETLQSGINAGQLMPGGYNKSNFAVLPLFGRMSISAQGAIFRTSKKRKIIIATNVAETSVTVPGIRFVIDSGLARIATYSPRMRTTKLPVQAISSASADQRKGRCGRVGPGVCIRLYSEEDYLNRPRHTQPEIMRSNLAEVILRMTNLRLGHPARFPFIDPPKKRAINDGISVLQELGAIKSAPHDIVLTKRGRIMAKLPLDPSLARIVLEAKERNVLNQIIIIVAALSIQDPRNRPLGEEQKADSAHKQFVEPGSDFVSYLNLWKAFHHVSRSVNSRTKLRKFCRQNFLAYQRMREWMDIYEQICRALEEKTEFSILAAPVNSDAIHQSLLSGLIRNIACKKEKKLFIGAYGREVMIFPGSGQFKQPPQWILAAELVETNRLYARTVGGINPKWLERIAANLCKHSYSDPHWEKKRGHVVAFEKTTLFGLIINEGKKIHYGPIDHKASREIFIQSALVEGQVNRRLDFLTKNLKLIQKMQDIEDKVRTRHVIDDYTLYAFYDARIPSHIVSLADLVKVLPTVNSLLLMSENDICSDAYDQSHQDKFPATLSFDTFEFHLSYKFEPGSSEDGVSVLIPSSALQHINPLPFDWLVPGLFPEKVMALIKSLPKALRKHLVPVNKAAEVLVSGLHFGKGSLLGQLSELLVKHYQLDVEKKMWQLEALPIHLKMRFCLIDGQGRVLKQTRDFNELFTYEGNTSSTPNSKDLRVKWEQERIESYEKEIPQRLPIETSSGISGYLFPGMIDKGNGTVGIHLFATESDQLKSHRAGLLALYKKALARQISICKKELKFVQNDWAMFHWLGSLKDVNRRTQDFILFELFSLNEHGFQTQEEFRQRVMEFSKEGFFSAAAFLFAKLRKTLGFRRETYDLISKFSTLSGADTGNGNQFGLFFDELAKLLPPNFLETYSMNRVEQVWRYMEALRIRTERAYASPASDTKKAAFITPFNNELLKLKKEFDDLHVPARKKMVADSIDDFSIMIEEYKISVFAPEMKTRYKVSEKRLFKKIQDIRGQL